MTMLPNGAELIAHFHYAGFGDYWGGYGCADNAEHSEHLVYAFYGKKTTLADIIDELVEDAWNGPAGETLPDDCDTDAVRRTLVEDMLNNRGRADYASGALAECAVEYAAANEDTSQKECPGCGAEDDGYSDECESCGRELLDDDPDADDEDDCGDCCESPIFVVILEYVKPDEDEGPVDPKDCLGYSCDTKCGACDAYEDCADREDWQPVTVESAELVENGYSEITEDHEDGRVVIRKDEGGYDVFQVRASYSGWSLDTEDGRVLEFCYSIAPEENTEDNGHDGGDGRDLADVIGDEGFCEE